MDKKAPRKINIISPNGSGLLLFLFKKYTTKHQFNFSSSPGKGMNLFLHNSSINRILIINKESINIYVSLEPFEYENGISDRFLDQFDGLILSDEKCMHANVFKHPNFIPWIYNTVVMSNGKHKISFNSQQKVSLMEKKINRAVLVVSNKQTYSSHKQRLKILKEIKKHKIIKNIDIYGFGFKEFKNKRLLFGQYEFAIVLENSKINDYFSEKLIDSLISNHKIAYWGCKNLRKYIDDSCILEFSEGDLVEKMNLFHEEILGISNRMTFPTKKTLKDIENSLSIFGVIERSIHFFGNIQQKRSVFLPNYFFTDNIFKIFFKQIKNMLLSFKHNI